MSLLDEVQQRLGPSEISKISQQLGVDEGTAQQAVQTALPSMVAGMAGHAQTPTGASTMEGMFGGLGNLGGGAGGGGLLGKIFGQHHDAVHDEVKANTGLDSGKVGSLLSMLAPIVISAIANRSQQGSAPGGGMGGLGGMLAREAQSMQHNAGGAGTGGLLGQVLGQFS